MASASMRLHGPILPCAMPVQRHPLKIARLKINRESGVSLEAAARDERYRIFAKLKADYVVLAQHLDDQAETLLLQLLRGAGVKGLGAMPVVRNPASGIRKQISGTRSNPREGQGYYGRYSTCHGARSRATRWKMHCNGLPMKVTTTSLSTVISCAVNFFLCLKSVFLLIAPHFCAQAGIWRRHPSCWTNWPKPIAKNVPFLKNFESRICGN